NFNTKNDKNSHFQKVNNLTHLGYKIIESKLDFELPFESINFESGLKFSKTENNSNIKYFNLLPNPVLIDSKSNEFNYKEYNYAIYVGADKKLSEQWSVKAGLRYEYTQNEGFTPKNNVMNKNYYGKLFPTFYANYKLNAQNNFSLSYSKRIDRPNFRALNPFKWYDNPYYYSEGNPALSPSFLENIEFKYSHKSYIFSAYYIHSENDYGQYVLPYKNGTQGSTYMNYFNTNKYGVQFSMAKQLTNWWYNSSNINGFYAKSNTFDGFTIGQESFGAYLNFNNTFNLNSDKTFNIIINYSQSLPHKTGNKEFYNQYSLDTGLKLNLLNDKLNLSLTLNDILKTSLVKGKVLMKDQTFEFDNYYDTRYLSFEISYSFGNNKVKGSEKEINFEEKNRSN
ncbi:outer membrane beta-barrel family protein, partial [Ornithobacterium rhinotracheale]|uniref:outer membrane beta-barrel family protein n=1 Tax=Ornithobacterium rhinotracheale TaxID=28251 RepID=UPI001FF252F2